MENNITGVTEILQVQKVDESSAREVRFENVVKDIINEKATGLVDGFIKTDFSDKESVTYIEPFLASIVRNLLDNAIKYSREGIPLEIEITSSEEKGYAVLTMKDNGIGIDLEKHGPHLFTPFRRIGEKEAEGSGIGLYLIKNIIEKNGGYIKVESICGAGTAFRCYLKEYQEEAKT